MTESKCVVVLIFGSSQIMYLAPLVVFLAKVRLIPPQQTEINTTPNSGRSRYIVW